MLTFDYGSHYFWDKIMLTKFISGCQMAWDLFCGTSWFYKSKTKKVCSSDVMHCQVSIFEIKKMVKTGVIFMSCQKLKKLQEAESLPFCPSVAAFFL